MRTRIGSDEDGDVMPLNEHEQRILDEIERRLYEEDPKLAETVKKASLGRVNRRRVRVAALLFVVGLVIMLGSFTRSAPVAGLGFVIMVASGGWIAMSIRAARTTESGGSFSVAGWADRFLRRWRRDR